MKKANLLLILICGLLVLVSGCMRTLQANRASDLRADLYVEAMKNVLLTSGGPSEFIAIKFETLEGLNNEQKQWVIQQMQVYSKNIYSYDQVKNDPGKFHFQNGDRTGAKNGVVLSVKLIKFEPNQAELETIAWYGNLGMDSITYRAKYENGSWVLKVTAMTKA